MPTSCRQSRRAESHPVGGVAKLLSAIRPANGFYETKLSPTGISADLPSLDEYRKRCPFTTKAELVADHQAHPPYSSNLTFPQSRYTRAHQTSGTSGQPMRWLDLPRAGSG